MDGCATDRIEFLFQPYAGAKVLQRNTALRRLLEWCSAGGNKQLN
jgi:hypothetical protein